MAFARYSPPTCNQIILTIFSLVQAEEDSQGLRIVNTRSLRNSAIGHATVMAFQMASRMPVNCQRAVG